MDFERTLSTDTDTALDSAALAQALPEVAVAAAAVARTGAVALVPDANGTVVLPEGASLDDITVRGRDLIIQTDDGRIYIIVDGAVFVPQVVAQGVTVPPLNLAALLIGNEPEPAAGGVRSSGGNFAVPVGSIQDAFKIGDLLPYTELRFPEPQQREIFPGIDTEPRTGPNADVLLDDDALAGGNAGGSGDDADSANATGILFATGGDGALTWSLSTGGAPAGFTYAANGTGLDIFQGAVKVLAVTLNPVTGAYTVTQLAPIVHAAGGAENNQLFTLTYSVTDIDGDTASGTLGINVDDDTPIANPDTDTVAAGQFGPATGNVLTDAAAGDAGDSDNGRDSAGADGGLAITAISGFGGAGSLSGVTQGQYGVLTLDAAGNYSYVRSAGTPGGVTDTFTYTVRDGDGDTATATLTITIADAVPQTAPNAVAQLDDDALPGGNPGGLGDDANSANATGTLAASGGDGALVWALSASGAPAGFSYVANGTGIDVFQGATKVLAVTLNSATGGYTVTQIAAIAHPAGGDTNSVPENNTVFTIGYTATDIDGDAAPGTLTINVDDDSPVVTATGTAPALLVDESNLAANAVQDFSTIFTHSFGADGPAASGSLAYTLGVVSGPSGLVDTLSGQPVLLAMNGAVVEGRTAAGLLVFTVAVDAAGSVTLDQSRAIVHTPNGGPDDVATLAANLVTLTRTATDSDGDTASATANIGGSLRFGDDAPAAANDADALLAGTTGPATGNVLTDAEGDGGKDAPGADGGSVTAVTGANGAGTIGSATTGLYGDLTLNADGSYSYVRTTTGPINAADVFTYTLTDGDGDTATATLTITLADAGPVTGPNAAVLLDDDALAGGNAGGPGDDVDAANTTGTLAASGGDGALGYALTGVTLPAGFTASVVNPGLLQISQNGTVVLTVTLDTVTGAYSVTQNAALVHPAGGDENNLGFTLGYSVTDADGDSAAGTLAISVDDDTPLAANDTDEVVLGASSTAGNVLSGAGADSNPAGADSIGADGAGPAGAVTAVSGFGGAGVIGGIAVGQYGRLELNADGSYVYTRASGVPGNAQDVFTYTITDQDGDTATATLTISIEDARPFTGPNAPVQLDDDALAGGNAGGVGDADPDTANLTGTLSGSGGDGALTWALGTLTVPAGFTAVQAGTGLIEVSQGGTLVLRITLDPATGAYTVTQTAAIAHPAGGDENDVAFTLAYTVSDADGDSASGSLVINVDDDTPTVSSNGTAPVLSVDETVFATNDTKDLSTLFSHSFGADGPAAAGSTAYALGVIAGPSGLVDTLSGQPVVLAMNGAVVEGRAAGLLVFTVSVDAAGKVTLDQSRAVVHTPNLSANDVAALAADLVTLTKTVTDNDGDSASATIGIGDHLQFVDDAPSAGANANVVLNDDLLAGGNAGGAGDTGAAQNAAGTLAHSFGNDGGSIAFLTSGAPAGFQYVASGANILVQQSQGGALVTVATVMLDTATGAYTVTQNAPVLHPASSATEENTEFTLNYAVTDGDGDTAPGTLKIVINDDTPTAANDVDSVTEDGPVTADGNVFTGSGGSDANATDGVKDSIGADSVANPVTAVSFGAVAGVIGTPLNGAYGSLTLNADGSYSYALDNANPLVQGLDTGESRTDTFTYAITDRDGDTVTATLTITINGTNDAPVVQPGTSAISEEGLTLGNPDTTGNTDTTDSSTTTGTIVATDADGEPLTYTLGLPTTTLTSGGVPITWTGVGSGTLTGSAGGTPVITVTIDASGNYTVTLLDAVDQPDLTVEDSINLVIPVSVSDGTTSTGTTITVSIEDDSPVAVQFVSTVGSVDEDGLPGGLAGGTGDIAGEATVATGSVAGLFKGGADTAPQYLLTTVTGLPVLTSGGVAVTYSLSTATNVLTATAGGAPVFTLAIDKASGAWTFTLQGPVDQASGNAENNLVLDFAAIVQAVDVDGDRASVAGTFQVTINDDTPVAVNDAAIQATENTPVTINVFANDKGGADGTLASTTTLVAGSLTNGGAAATGTLVNNGNGTFTYTPGVGEEGTITFQYTITDKDGDTSQATATITLLADSAPKPVAVGATVDDDGLVGGNPASTVGDVDANAGENPASASEAVFNGKIAVDFGNDTGTVSLSNLDLATETVGTEGVRYTWDAATNTLTATITTGVRTGTPLFTVKLSANGDFTVTLLDNVLHAPGGNETGTSVSLNYLATDSDGDSSTTGQLIVAFNDDAPTATVVVANEPALTVDETVLATNASASFASVFTPNFGADGAAAGGGIGYTLNVVAGASGLVDTLSGKAVNLSMNGSVVEGRTADSNLLVFTVSVDAAGVVTLDQLRAVVHSPNTGPNQSISLAADDLVTLTGTFTDADGDTGTATANIGQNLVFLDDAPTPVSPTAISLTNQAGGPVTASLDPNLLDNYGADGGTPRFSPTLNGTNSGLTSNLNPIVYSVSADGLTLTGTAGGSTIFTINLLPGTNQYAVDMDGKVDSLTTLDFASGAYQFVGGNTAWVGFVPSGQNTTGGAIDDNSKDLLITPSVAGDFGGTINGSSVALGVGTGNAVDPGEMVRLDFVTDLRGDTGGSGGYVLGANRDHVFDGHYTTNGASALITSTSASGSTIKVTAKDDFDTNTVVGDGAIDPITRIGIAYAGVSSGVIIPTTTATNYTVNGKVFTVQLNADGSVNVGGVVGSSGAGAVGTQIAAFTADGYSSLEFAYVSGSDFKLGNFGAVIQNTNPVNFTVPVEVIDGDGDVSAPANLAITLTAPATPPVAIDLDGNGVQYLSAQHGVAYDLYADGVTEQTAWVAAGDGLLARDANGSGTVDSASEFVFGGNGQTDLQAIAATYDSNADGVLDAKDAAFAQFGVWQDANSNGVSDPGEFKTLAEMGIASIDLTSDGKTATAAGGDVSIFGTTTYTKTDGTTGVAADVAFATGAATTLQRQAQPAELAALSAAATGLLAAMAMDHAKAAADAGLTKAVSASADQVPAPAAAAADLPAAASPTAFAQFATHAESKTAPADTTGHGANDNTLRTAGSLDAPADRGADHGADHADTGKSVLFAAADAHAAMDALLTVAAPAAAKSTAALAGVDEALADTAASHAVDSIVDHFAPGSGVELGATVKVGDFALQGLLDSSVHGSGSDAGSMHLMPVLSLDHEQAAAMA